MLPACTSWCWCCSPSSSTATAWAATSCMTTWRPSSTTETWRAAAGPRSGPTTSGGYTSGTWGHTSHTAPSRSSHSGIHPYLHTICTLSTQYLHTIYTRKLSTTHSVSTIYTLSTQYLHTIFLATSHPGQQREEGPRGHFNSDLIPHHLFWLYFIWFRIHGRYLQHYNLASWEPPICENLEKRLLGHTINVTENNKNHWH